MQLKSIKLAFLFLINRSMQGVRHELLSHTYEMKILRNLLYTKNGYLYNLYQIITRQKFPHRPIKRYTDKENVSIIGKIPVSITPISSLYRKITERRKYVEIPTSSYLKIYKLLYAIVEFRHPLSLSLLYIEIKKTARKSTLCEYLILD